MREPKPITVSLLWRILLSTSVAITVLFLLVGWIVQDQVGRTAAVTLEEEAKASFQAYESLWRARADQLASVSLVLSRMPDVRAAFSTMDRATIHDTAHEVWSQLSKPGTLFLVCDPRGRVIASEGAAGRSIAEAAFVRAAGTQFPQQARGFEIVDGTLYQIVVTPVYVSGGLLDVLVAGIPVDTELVQQLRAATGNSEFVFVSQGHVVASTLPVGANTALVATTSSQDRVGVAGSDYYQFITTLPDLDRKPLADLRILRSFDATLSRIDALRFRLTLLWLGAVLTGFVLTYLLAHRLLKPVEALVRAAGQIGKGNYDVRVAVESRDEMGRLAETFNGMCASISSAREDLIRQERISTISRLSTSIIHDLRNPLAAIYGGAEMLVDTQLSPSQVQRLAANIYRASRQIQDLLQELSDATQGRAHAREMCRLREVVQAAYEALSASAEAHGVAIRIDVPEDVELPLDRSPMERVFQNLLGNAIEAMPEGGTVTVTAERNAQEVVVQVEDTGPGIPVSIAGRLFEPFVTAGKNNGMGLGLALSRKAVLAHGGDLWAEGTGPGARFLLRLPV